MSKEVKIGEGTKESLIYEDSVNILPSISVIADKVMAQKKVKADLKDIINTLEQLYKVFKYFNSIKENTPVAFDSIPLAEVKVLNEFKDFIVPVTVRFDVLDLRAKDLSLKEGIDKAPMSYNDYINCCDVFRSYFKSDASSNVTSLADLKAPAALSSIMGKVSNKVDGVRSVNYGNEPYYPIRLADVSVLWEPRHFNATEEDIMKDYLAFFRF